MAAAPDPNEVLRSTDGKANFQRLVRLLISGGTSLLREIFDTIHPPSNLPTVLSKPATKKQLATAKLTKPQWDCLYPSPGVYGKSTDFDVTLLFRLLRTITHLTPPATGWDALPASTDHSLTADLARIKYHRNSVYGHVNQKMEIPDDQFLTLWQEISEALVRIAAQISCEKKTAWQKAIDDYRKDPLTADDERNVKELERWYKNDMDVKKTVEELKTTTQEGIDHLKTSQNDFQVEISRMMERGAQWFETAVQEEHQVTRNQLEKIYREFKLMNKFISSVAPSWSTEEEAKMILKKLWTTYHTGQVNEMEQTFHEAENFLKKHDLIEEYTACRQGALKSPAVQLQNENEDTKGLASQGRATGTSIIPQEPQAVVQGATVAQISSNQPQALITTGTDPPSMENDDHPSDLPENQESLQKIILEQFEQLHRQRSDLFIAGHEWIQRRQSTKVKLMQLLTRLRIYQGHTHQLIMLGVTAIRAVFSAVTALTGRAPAAATGTATAVITTPQLLVLKEVLKTIAEDRIACIEFQQQFDSLENFISTTAKFLKHLHNDPVLLRALESDFGARYCRAVTSASRAVTRSAALMRELVAPITDFEKDVALLSEMSTVNSIEFLLRKIWIREPDELAIWWRVASNKFT